MSLHKGFYKLSSDEAMNVWTTQQTIQLFFKMSIKKTKKPNNLQVQDQPML